MKSMIAEAGRHLTNVWKYIHEKETLRLPGRNSYRMNSTGAAIVHCKHFGDLSTVTTLQIGSDSGLDSSPYGIPRGNQIEDRPVYIVYNR